MAGKIFSDIYTESARDTGDQTTSHITYVKKKVNDALRDICSEMRYSWLQRAADVALTASLQYYPMSTLAANWDEDTPISIYYRDAANKRQDLDCYDDNEWMEEEDIDEGDCYGFNVNKKAGVWRVYFTHVPDGEFVSSYSPLKMEYQKYPTELSADSDIPELPANHHQALVYKTNALISVEMGDSESALAWDALAERSLGKLRAKQVNRKGKPKRVYPSSSITIRVRAYRVRDYNL